MVGLRYKEGERERTRERKRGRERRKTGKKGRHRVYECG